MFLSEDPELLLRRGAIIFLLCKIYFTDDLANMMKLRITSDEWSSFKEYMESIQELKDYKTIQIMFYHLFTEGFFKLTVKNKALALDYGSPNNEMVSQLDSNQDIDFWNGIRNDIITLENTEVVDLINLNAKREEAIKPFEDMFPERGLLTEALHEFEMIKQLIQEPAEPAPSRITQKQVSIACRDFLKASGAGSVAHQSQIDQANLNEDSESSTAAKRATKSKRRKEGEKPKADKKPDSDSSSSNSDNEKDFRRMNRSLGYKSQNIMRGIGASKHFSEKLNKCYGKIE